MILTTTNTLEGHTIQEYLGIVTGVSVSMPKATLSFSMQKYYDAYETKINEVKEDAFQKLQKNAEALKASAVVAITIDIETSPSTGVVFVSVTGTAVKMG